MPVYRSAFLPSIPGYEHYESAPTCLEADYFTPPSMSSHFPDHVLHGTCAPQTVMPSDTQYYPSSSPPPPTPVSPTASSPAKKSSHARRKDPNHIPRPRNAFIIFRSTYLSTRKAAKGDLQNEISKQAAVVWNGMDLEERKPFMHRAMQEKAEHERKYPGYIYAPGRVPGKSKSTKTSRPSSKAQRRVVDAPATSPAPTSPASCGSPETPQQVFVSAGQGFYTAPCDGVNHADASKEQFDTTLRPFNYNTIDSQFAGLCGYHNADNALCGFLSSTPPPEDEDHVAMFFPFITPFAFPDARPTSDPTPRSSAPTSLEAPTPSSEVSLPHPNLFSSALASFDGVRDASEFDFSRLPVEGEAPVMHYAQATVGLWYPVQPEGELISTLGMELFFDYQSYITGSL